MNTNQWIELPEEKKKSAEEKKELSICENCSNEVPSDEISNCEKCDMDGLCNDCQDHDEHSNENS